MRKALVALVFCNLACRSEKPMKGILLEDLTWQEAERVLTPEAIVVIPLGASAKEHGPHLRLDNDRVIAEYFRDRLLEEEAVVMAPLIAHHYYPAFVEYPGSITLRLETARDLVVDVVKSLAAYGPRRFYILNTGVSTVKALALSREVLEGEGIVMRYTDLKSMEEERKQIARQEGGTHADEIETSMMLHIVPHRVDMRLAVKDYDPVPKKGLSRTKSSTKTYSPSGIFGDATLASEEKGARMVEVYLNRLREDLRSLRSIPAPPRATGSP
jgi:creatinine amidohydrolase